MIGGQAHTSEIDKAVFELRSQTEHIFETITVNGEIGDYCTRCGKNRRDTSLPESPYRTKCKGFV
jgi:hypothetical protein